MATYRKADDDIHQQVRDLIFAKFAKIKDAGVTVDVLLAHAPRNKTTDEPTGPAINHQGYPACAVIKINSLKHRVQGCADATITLDGDKIDEWSPRRLESILVHELTHLELQYDQDGNIKTDSASAS